MIDYTKYEVEDFANDDEFIAWCVGTYTNKDRVWQELMRSNPDLSDKILDAKNLVLDLQTLEIDNYTNNFEKEVWDNIQNQIEDHIPSKSEPTQKKINYINFALAAVIALCLGLIFLMKIHSNPLDKDKVVDWINYENNTGLSKEIDLADGSKVILEPFSYLKYPSEFTGKQRVVVLQGEAFFDIERDTLKPFLVYANETITKVLGTSFTVVAFEGEKSVEVEVVTGKVAVYANVASIKNKNKSKQPIAIQTDNVEYIPRPNKKLEILPNQKVVFNSKKGNMTRQVASLPILLTKLSNLPQFSFDNEPIEKFFFALEKAYGIDIVYEEDLLKNCKITTELKDEPLFEKLDIVSMALDLTYEQIDGKIIVNGSNCN